MRFTDWHSAASVCTPARAGLMTGRLPTRFGMHGNFGPSSLYGMPRTEYTIAELLKAGAGYATMVRTIVVLSSN